MNRRIAKKIMRNTTRINGDIYGPYRVGTVLAAMAKLSAYWRQLGVSCRVLAVMLLAGTANAQSLDARCDSPKMQLVLITQQPCPPCRVASALLDKMDLREYVRSEWDIRRDAGKIAKLGIGRVARTPTLVLLDSEGSAVSSIDTVDQAHVDALLDLKPVKLAEPIVLDDFIETIEPPLLASDRAFSATEITWDLATEYQSGAYNGSFAFGSIQYALSSLGRYHPLTFRRVTRGGQLHVIQSSRNGPGAAWTNGATIKVSPTFRFINEVHCGMVIVHEFLHVGNGTSHHAQDGGIMGPSGGYLLLASDFPWMQKRGWKSALRPTDEPEWFKKYLSRNAVLGADDSSQFPLMNSQRELR